MVVARAKIGDAWLQVALSMDGIEKALQTALTRPIQKAGTQAGKDLGDDLTSATSKAGAESGKEFSTNFNKNNSASKSVQKVGDEIKGLKGDLGSLDLNLGDIDFGSVEEDFSNMGDELKTEGVQIGGVVGEGFGKAMIGALAAWKIGEFLQEEISNGFEQQGEINKTVAALNLDPAETKRVTEASTTLYSQAYGDSFEAVQEAMKGIVSSISGAREASSQELEGMGKDVLNLSSTYGLGSEEILKAVQTQLSSGFASSWDEAVSNVLSGMQTLGANGEDYLETLNEYSDDFKTLGLSGPKALNLINEALKKGVRNTDVFADALQEFQIRAGDQSSWKALQALGFDPKQVEADLQAGGDRAEKALTDVWTKLQATNNRNAFGQVFGTQAEDYFSAFENVDLSVLNNGLEQGTGDMEKFNETINSGANVSLEEFNRLIEQGFVDILQPILEIVTPLLSDFVGFLTENSAAAAVFAGILGGVFLLAVIALTAALWAMVAPVLANPLTWEILLAVAAIALLIAAIWLIVDNWDAIVYNISNVWNGFMGFLGDSIGAIGDWFVEIGKGIGNFFIGIVNFVIGAINTIINGLNSLSFTFPAWLGGGTVGFNIATIGEVPSLADGGTIPATPGGVLTRISEAGKAESVVDAGLLNTALDQGLKGSDEGNSNSGLTMIFQIYQQPGQDAQELADAIANNEAITSLRPATYEGA